MAFVFVVTAVGTTANSSVVTAVGDSDDGQRLHGDGSGGR